MDEGDAVRRAAEGDSKAFALLFATYKERVLGYFATRIRNRALADDLSQEAFLRAFARLDSLRDPERFGPWLFAICRNALRAELARRAREPGSLAEELAVPPEPADSEWEGFSDRLRFARAALPDELLSLVRLRYDAELSYAEIAAATGLAESLVKSRLHRARARLRLSVEALAEGALPDPSRMRSIKERIMGTVESRLEASRIIERLSLADQIELARAARAGTRLPERLLAGIGAVPGGEAFIAARGASLRFDEFVEALNYADRFTEKRLIERLDEIDPELSETLKRNMFVFEDLTLCDAALLRQLHAEVARPRMLAALYGVQASYRRFILAPLSEAERAGIEEALARCDASPDEVKAAQDAVIAHIRAMESQGRIRSRRPGEVAPGEPFLTLVEGR